MPHKRERPTKQVRNRSIVAVRRETFEQDIAGLKSSGLCTACRNTVSPIRSSSAMIGEKHRSRTRRQLLPSPHCRLKRAYCVGSPPACHYARLLEEWISTRPPYGAEFHQRLIDMSGVETDGIVLGPVRVDEEQTLEQEPLGIEWGTGRPVGTDFGRVAG